MAISSSWCYLRKRCSQRGVGAADHQSAGRPAQPCGSANLRPLRAAVGNRRTNGRHQECPVSQTMQLSARRTDCGRRAFCAGEIHHRRGVATNAKADRLRHRRIDYMCFDQPSGEVADRTSACTPRLRSSGGRQPGWRTTAPVGRLLPGNALVAMILIGTIRARKRVRTWCDASQPSSFWN